MSETPPARNTAALKVAVGIFSSRVIGLLRARAYAYFFGVSAYADVLSTAFKAPNFLQNLLGEGTMSAAFIPIYSRMLQEGRNEEAGRFAGAVFGLLLALTTVLVVGGVLLAEPIVTILTPGFVGEPLRFDLTVQAVRIIFPMTGVLVFSAWALGVLNSHRRFFVPYIAPVAWNVAIIVALFVGAWWLIDDATLATGEGRRELLLAACWGALAGGLLQFAVQLPAIVQEMRGFRISFSTRVEGVGQAIRAFGPVVAGRGVYQLSAYLDYFLASFLLPGAMAAIQYAQMLYLLPISLFGMSVAAAELPELSRLTENDLDTFLVRIERSLRQMMFLTIPTFVGYLGLGYLFVGALYQTGSFSSEDNWQVYFVLMAYTLGLLATTAGRLLQNVFYALHDTRTPARIAVIRVVSSALLAIPFMYFLDRVGVHQITGLPDDGTPLTLGAVGLALGTGIAGWIEFSQLSLNLHRRLSHFKLPIKAIAKMIGLAVTALVPAFLLWYVLPSWHVLTTAVTVIAVYGLTYVALAYFSGVAEAASWVGTVLRRIRR